MKEYYYAHILYDNPAVNSYEYIIDLGDVNLFGKEIIKILESSYNEIYGTEEMNLNDIGGWEEFIEKNKIDYKDGDWFPYEIIWKCIIGKLKNSINRSDTDDIKYIVIEETIQMYLFLIECANFDFGEYLFEIIIFNNSRDFACHFFSYLRDTIQNKTSECKLMERIDTICKLIESNRFPTNDLQEGILVEWKNIYDLFYEN